LRIGILYHVSKEVKLSNEIDLIGGLKRCRKFFVKKISITHAQNSSNRDYEEKNLNFVSDNRIIKEEVKKVSDKRKQNNSRKI